MRDVAAGRRVTYGDVLANPEFRALYLAQALNIVGDMLARIAVALLVFARSHSALLTALSFAVTYLPALVGGPLLSGYADRHPRQQVMVLCDLARAVVILGIAIPHLPLALAFVLVAVVSVLDAPFNAARAAILPDVLTEQEDYAVAVGLTSMTGQLGQVIGFAVGGALVAAVSTRGAIAIDCLTFLASAVLVGTRVRRRPAAAPGEASPWADLKEGARAAWSDYRLRYLIAVAWAVVVASIAPEALAVPYAHAHGGGPLTAGALTAAVPLGAVLGAILVGRIIDPALAERLMTPTAIATPAVLALTAFDPGPAVVAVIWAVTGFMSATIVTLGRVIVRDAPSQVRGRVIGLTGTGLAVAQGMGALLTGWIASQLGPAVAIADAALPMLAVLVLLATFAQKGSSNAAAPPTPERSNPNDQGAPIGATVRRRPEPRVWATSLLLTLVAAAVLAGMHRDRPLVSTDLPVAWFVLLFLVVHAYPIHFEFRKKQRSVQFESVPLALGLFFLTPLALVEVRVLAVVLVQTLLRRQSLILTVVNSASTALFTVVDVAVFHAVGPGHHGVHPQVWPAAILAVITDDVVSAAVVTWILSFYEKVPSLRQLAPPLLFSLLVSTVNTCLALVTASAVTYDAANAAAITVFVVLSLAGFRTYHRLADRHAVLDRLYAFARDLGPITADPADLGPALSHLRLMLKARELEMTLLREDGSASVVAVYDEGDHDGVRVQEAAAPALAGEAAAGAARPARGLFRRRRGSTMSAEQISVPVSAAGTRVGELRATSHADDGRVFDRNDLRLLEAVADQLATALEKGRLIEGLKIAATRDSLTGLANLDSLREFLTAMLDEGSNGVLLLLDVDRFHDINDTVGHEVGDQVLIEVARRLDDAATHGSLTCRVGGDQFALVIPGQSSGELARLAALHLKSRVDGPLRLADVSADIRVTIGMARSPEHGADATTLLRRAEIAMGSAKGGSAGIAEWEPHMERDGSRRLYVLSGLRQALADSDLTVEFQPKLQLGDGAVTGFEALVRWRHPELGLVSPAEFIPLAEATGLIGALTSSVLRMALETCRRWHDNGKHVNVAVNISARSLDDPVLVGQVAALLTASGLESRWLTLELTESSVMQNPARSMEVLRQLRSLGVRLSIDDFGTGYSSLHYLRGLPVHEVKIDKTFVDNLGHDGADRAVVRAVVELCDSLGLVTVAEGVENAAQAYALESLGVREVQGYFYGRPMPESDASAWLRQRPVALKQEEERQRG